MTRAGTTRAAALGHLESEIGILIRRARRVIRDRAQAVHPDLAPATYLMLAYVAESGPVRASVVADCFAIDKSGISRQCQHLIDLGLLERTTDPGDRRAQLLAVTDEGRARLADVRSQRRKELDERLADWSLGDLEGLVADLARYNASLEADRDRPPPRP